MFNVSDVTLRSSDARMELGMCGSLIGDCCLLQGNTNASWRRQFFGDIAHGVKYFDLFLLQTSFSGYTCAPASDSNF